MSADYMSLRIAAARLARVIEVDRAEMSAMVDELDALRAAAPAKKSRAKKDAPTAEACPLPDWLPLDAWNAFLDMRKAIKKPATSHAQALLVKKLTAFYANDLDPCVILNQSIMNNWQDLYAPKEQSTAFRGAAGRPSAADQVAAAMKRRQSGPPDGFMGVTIDV